MFLLIRDEDAPTVAAAVQAFADEQGLEPIEAGAQADNPFGILAVLTGPRVLAVTADDQIILYGLESLDVADADEWASALSAACETEAVAVELLEEGVRVHVFDGGEPDETIDVTVDASGRTRAPALAELATDEGRVELEGGIEATSVAELAEGILRCLGAMPPGEDAVMLAFHDPLADDDEEPEP